MAHTYAYELGQAFVSLNAVALANGSPPANGQGDAVGVGPIYHGNDTPKEITWDLNFSGAPATITVNLEGTLDNASDPNVTPNWYQLDQTTTVANQARSVVFKPYRYYRLNITVVSGAPAGTLTGRIYLG